MYVLFDRERENIIINVMDVLVGNIDNTIGVLEIERDEQIEDYFYYKVNAEETGIEYSEAAKELRTRVFLEQNMFEMRETRNKLLKETDKYALPDWPHKTPEIRQAWLDYRQALRDLPSKEDLTWPTPP
jgi:hypothetical protein